MWIPQDFIEAINAAVRAVNPDAPIMVSGSMTLGSDFDEWLGPEGFKKYGFGNLPPDALAAFEAKFSEKREELKASMIASAIEIEKKRMAGTLEDFSFNDSRRAL
jgi:hypothetical protein